MSEEDTIKIGLKLPNDSRVLQFYDYRFKVRDLAGKVLLDERVSTLSWRTEVALPNSTAPSTQKPSTRPASASSPTTRAPATPHCASTERCWWGTRRARTS